MIQCLKVRCGRAFDPKKKAIKLGRVNTCKESSGIRIGIVELWKEKINKFQILCFK